MCTLIEFPLSYFNRILFQNEFTCIMLTLFIVSYLLRCKNISQLTSTPSDVVWCSPTILAAGLFRASSVRCQPSAAVSTLNLRPPPAGGSVNHCLGVCFPIWSYSKSMLSLSQMPLPFHVLPASGLSRPHSGPSTDATLTGR